MCPSNYYSIPSENWQCVCRWYVSGHGRKYSGTPEEIYQQTDIDIKTKEPQPEDVII